MPCAGEERADWWKSTALIAVGALGGLLTGAAPVVFGGHATTESVAHAIKTTPVLERVVGELESKAAKSEIAVRTLEKDLAHMTGVLESILEEVRKKK